MNFIEKLDDLILHGACQSITHRLQVESKGKWDNFDIASQIMFCMFTIDFVAAMFSFMVQYFALLSYVVITFFVRFDHYRDFEKISLDVRKRVMNGEMNEGELRWFESRIASIFLCVATSTVFISALVLATAKEQEGVWVCFAVWLFSIATVATFYFLSVTPLPPNVARERKEAKSKKLVLVPIEVGNR
jgi:FlaA1/EpsC-like NDP-sugar epimerase